MTTAQREAILTADERIDRLTIAKQLYQSSGCSFEAGVCEDAIEILRSAAQSERDDLRPFGVYAPDAPAAIAEAARLVEGAR
jgi:hypothetical protein